ncbi:tryptophan 7-halogenase [Gymnodinialimonas sp. 2305UL16-5]|uniref:tryptophan 7-halogenase n=1 Tax=Gymnodinialimonas mytili TaxID=3126503 RepID=UPI0030B0C6E4
MTDFDVAIIGGGPAGAAAALTLRKRKDIRVALIERGDYSTPKVGESLSPGTRSLLQYLGLWDRFEAEQTLSLLGSEAAWGSDTLGTMDFILTLHGAGWALDRARFERMMANAAEDLGTVLMTNTNVAKCRYDGACWRLDLGKDELTARYVIDAAGRGSFFSTRQGGYRQRNDMLTAITARLPAAANVAQVTRVEAFKDGWWYAAPLPSGEVIVCLFSDAARIHRLRLSAPDIWAHHLAETRHISPLVAPEPCALETLPAFSSLLQGGDPNRPMIAAGDAIAARDPLSSSGIPNAMGSGIQAARVAADWLFGAGTLRSAYLDSIARDHSAYLKTHWKTYRTEARWPDAPFWRFRSAQVTRRPNTMVHLKRGAEGTIFVPGRAAQWIIEAAQKSVRQIDLVTGARDAFPDLPDERLILAVEDLTDMAEAGEVVL